MCMVQAYCWYPYMYMVMLADKNFLPCSIINLGAILWYHTIHEVNLTLMYYYHFKLKTIIRKKGIAKYFWGKLEQEQRGQNLMLNKHKVWENFNHIAVLTQWYANCIKILFNITNGTLKIKANSLGCLVWNYKQVMESDFVLEVKMGQRNTKWLWSADCIMNMKPGVNSRNRKTLT